MASTTPGATIAAVGHPSRHRRQVPQPSAAGESAKLATLIRASGFATGDHVVYPTHGVGKIESLEKQSIAGMDLDLIVIRFEKEKMTLRVPTNKAEGVGMLD